MLSDTKTILLITVGYYPTPKNFIIMQAIDLRQALIEANDVNLNTADALVETRVLRQLIASAEDRIKALAPDAKALAKEEMAKQGITSGEFTHNGHTYEGQRDVFYDIIGDPKKYNSKDAAQYRKHALDQKEHKKQSSVLTKAMKAIMDAFPSLHPKITPERDDITVKCID